MNVDNFIKQANLKPALFTKDFNVDAAPGSVECLDNISRIGTGIMAAYGLLVYAAAEFIVLNQAEADAQEHRQLYMELLVRHNPTKLFAHLLSKIVSPRYQVIIAKSRMTIAFEGEADRLLAFRDYLDAHYVSRTSGSVPKQMNLGIIRAGMAHCMREVLLAFNDKRNQPWCIYESLSVVKNQLPVEVMTTHVAKITTMTAHELGKAKPKDLFTTVKVPKNASYEVKEEAVSIYGLETMMDAVREITEYIPVKV